MSSPKKSKKYCVNKNADAKGNHEVHVLDGRCNHLPEPSNQFSLGFHLNCRAALSTAKKKGFLKVDGCAYCCKSCHKG